MAVASPTTRRPVNVVHSLANPAIVWLLPAPAGATSAVVAVAAVSITTTASRCPAFSPVCSAAARACSAVTSCGTARLAVVRICCSVSRWARVQYRSSFGGR